MPNETMPASIQSPPKAKRPTPVILNIGQEVAGRYEVTGQIGEGGMAVVYRATQKSLNRPVAIKAMHPKFAKDREFIMRFEAEAGALAGLQHPHIISIIDRGHENDVYYFVMEFVDGEDLDQKIVLGKLTPQDWRDIVNACGAAFDYVHRRGIIHRDIKPSNILIDKEGHVKIGDFGIAQIVQGDGEVTMDTDRALGTRHYMAPEQEHTPGDVDLRADIYALGVTFYKMLTKRLPINDFPMPSEVDPKIPLAVDQVLLKAMAEDRDERYATVKEFCDAMSKALRDNSVSMATMFTNKPKSGSSLYAGGDFRKSSSSTTQVKLGKDSTTKDPKKKTTTGGLDRTSTSGGRTATTAGTTSATSARTAVSTAGIKQAAPSKPSGKSPVLVAALIAVLAIVGIGTGVVILLQDAPTPTPVAASQRSVLLSEQDLVSTARQREELLRQQNEARLQQIMNADLAAIEEQAEGMGGEERAVGSEMTNEELAGFADFFAEHSLDGQPAADELSVSDNVEQEVIVE